MKTGFRILSTMTMVAALVVELYGDYMITIILLWVTILLINISEHWFMQGDNLH